MTIPNDGGNGQNNATQPANAVQQPTPATHLAPLAPVVAVNLNTIFQQMPAAPTTPTHGITLRVPDAPVPDRKRRRRL